MSRASALRQPDLFGAPQPDLFAGEPEPIGKPRSYAPDPAHVRAHLHQIVETARKARSMPWNERKVGFYKTVVPQMVRWLPDSEAAQIKLAFEREIARLEAA
jgi:hypothetical protein